jgi:cell fate (sporulation/competence/biofilm development) regulator YlbF (YheA/YmcA/DUF963 family)
MDASNWIALAALVISFLALAASGWSIHLSRRHKSIDLRIERNDRAQEVLLDSLTLLMRFTEAQRKLREVVEIGADIPEAEATARLIELVAQMDEIQRNMAEESENLSTVVNLLRKAGAHEPFDKAIEATQIARQIISEFNLRFSSMEKVINECHDGWTEIDPVATSTALIEAEGELEKHQADLEKSREMLKDPSYSPPQ